ncbi:MAG: hypothetical protein IJM43_07975 [Bacteroidaceae bacterium]|nr:hypothetical protein [Bacteroidaceae bacterium]
MIENKKTEKWSSLRLELQEFIPQEYCATCYIVTVYCSSEGYISTQKKNNTGHEHVGGHNITTLHFVDTFPDDAKILGKLGNHQNGFTAEHNNELNKGTPGQIVGQHFYINGGYGLETINNSNISG